MKKLSLIGVLALSVIYTSCSIEKRHHLNGYYISWNHKTEKATEQKVEPKEAAAITPVAENKTVEVAEQNAVENNIAPQVSEAVTTPSGNEVRNTAKNIIADVNKSEVKQAAPAVIKQANKSKAANSSAPSSEPDTVLLVILAILIPPLAMYLYEGSWTSRCTVNLILTLLCGLPGVIHALVVILGKK
jgi:uncharacterized membrane protein YqaE (UPF0057 family)